MTTHRITSIPVTAPDGNLIGKAVLEVDDGGNVRALMTLDSALGRELMTTMETGTVQGLSFGPVITPAIEMTSVMDPHRSFEREVHFVDAVSAFPDFDLNVQGRFETSKDYSVDDLRFMEPPENISFGPEEIESRFGFHKASLEGPNATAPKHADARRNFKAFAKWFDRYAPHSREKEVAMERLEEASMWFHKAIAKDAPLSKD